MITNKICYPLNITKDVMGGLTGKLSQQEIFLSSDKKEEYYPLSSAQKSLFIMEQMGNTGIACNIPVILSIEGDLDIAGLSRAINTIVERHEALRTSFGLIEGVPVQKVNESIRIKKVYKKCNEEDIDYITEEFVRPFNIYKPPLFRLELLKVSSEKHLLLLDFHNIIFDGLSLDVIIKELARLYSGEELSPLKVQYKNFTLWQNSLQRSDYIKEQEEYWLNVFSEESREFDLPFALSRRTEQDFQGNRFDFILDSELAERIRKLSGDTGTDICTILLASFNILLAKYTSMEDIVIGFPVTGRRNECLMGLVGMFINILPLRNFPGSDKTFCVFLSEVKQNLWNACNNQDYQVEVLIEKLNRKSGHSSLFDVVFLAENRETKRVEMDGLNIALLFSESQTTKFDLTLGVLEREEEINFHIEYRTCLFKPESIKRMAEHLMNILRNVTLQPCCMLGDIDILSQEERSQILYDFNRTKAEYPEDKIIVELFEEQVKRTPDNVAVVYKDKKLTYRELNEKANQLGRLLREKGVKPDDIVGIMVEPSLEMIVGAMAILKAGGGYIPIDSKYPTERINYMFQDSKASILLSQKHLYGKIDNFTGKFIDLEDESLYNGSSANPEIVTKPHNLAYVIYTSGSTGKPKGSMIEHNSLVKFSCWQRDSVVLKPEDRVSKYAGFGFDVSIGEIFPTLITGASLHVMSDDIRMSPKDVNEYFETNAITVAFLPTQFCEQFMEQENNSLRVLDVAGEKLKHYKKRNYKLMNKYGPTEYTVYTTSFLVDKPYDNIPIGKPIANTRIYVVDKNNKIQPLEVPGELCISGEGIARGYLNRPDLTAEKFVDNPFEPGTKMYRTGDLARWLPDGNIEYLGRMDRQIKIRGFRIELEEIEHVILEDEGISKAFVMVRGEGEEDNYICAYVISREEINSSEIKKRLSEVLPDYMLPRYIIKIEKIPLTANGKLDVKALPQPSEDMIEPYVASRNETENKLLEVWQEVLGVKKIGINDNFFALGGHSLMAIKLVAKLQMDFELTVNDIFKYQTIAQLSQNITRRKDYLKVKLQRRKEMALKDKDSSKDTFVEASLNSYRADIEKYYDVDFLEKRHYRNILLTGSTGYLGIHLLIDLLKETDIDIYLIIRGETQKEAAGRLDKKLQYYSKGSLGNYRDRVNVLKGDLSMERLGLEEHVYLELADKIDCIIHSAADVRHYGCYEDFYKSNVLATKNLLDFAREGRSKDFNHISTISVAEGNISEHNKLLFTEEDSDVGQKTENYYAKTKLEAEQLVTFARQEGLSANIFRIGNIVFHSQTGLFQENIEENAFYNMVKAFLNLGVVLKEEQIDFTYVDSASKAILLLYNREKLINETYHIINSPMNLAEVFTSKALKLNVDMLSTNEFIDYLYEHYDIPPFKTCIENIMLHKGWLGEETGNLVLVSDKTDLILRRLNFQWPREPARMRQMIARALTERLSFLKKVSVFSTLSTEELVVIAGLAREEYYPDESFILWEGDVNRNFYIIIEGHVEIMSHSRAGWPGTIIILGTGDFLGEECIWDNRSASLSAEVFMGDARVLAFKSDDFIRSIRDYPEFSIGLIREMSTRLRKYQKIIVEIG